MTRIPAIWTGTAWPRASGKTFPANIAGLLLTPRHYVAVWGTFGALVVIGAFARYERRHEIPIA